MKDKNIEVNLLKDIFPFKDSVEIMGIVKFKSSYTNQIFNKISNEKKQDNTLIPHIVFLVDISYSMNENKKIDTLKDALIKFIDYGYLDNSYLSIVTFGEKSDIVINYLKVSENKKIILDYIKNMEANEPQTYAYRGFKKIYNDIATYNRNGVNKVIYFTDGDDFDTQMAEDEALKLLKDRQFTITSVGTGIEYNETFLETIADIGRGGFYHLSSIDDFFNDIKFELQQTNNEIITQSEIVSLFYPTTVEPLDIYKVGKGVTKLDIDNNEIICGNITPDDRIYFRFRLNNLKNPGKFNILNATLKYMTGHDANQQEFSFKVILSNNKELLQNAIINNEVIQINKQIIAYKKVKEAQQYFNNGEEKKAKVVINEISPIIKSLSSDDEIDSILNDIKNGKSITAEITRTLLSHTRTKTRTKTDTQ